MSVLFEGGMIRIVGDCPVEEAETLLTLLQAHGAPVDLSHCGHLHAAPFQVLLALRPPIVGTSANAFVREKLTPMLTTALSVCVAPV